MTAMNQNATVQPPANRRKHNQIIQATNYFWVLLTGIISVVAASLTIYHYAEEWFKEPDTLFVTPRGGVTLDDLTLTNIHSKKDLSYFIGIRDGTGDAVNLAPNILQKILENEGKADPRTRYLLLLLCGDYYFQQSYLDEALTFFHRANDMECRDHLVSWFLMMSYQKKVDQLVEEDEAQEHGEQIIWYLREIKRMRKELRVVGFPADWSTHHSDKNRHLFARKQLTSRWDQVLVAWFSALPETGVETTLIKEVLPFLYDGYDPDVETCGVRDWAAVNPFLTGYGKDRLQGSFGNDLTYAGPGVDRVYRTAGMDTVDVAENNDPVFTFVDSDRSSICFGDYEPITDVHKSAYKLSVLESLNRDHGERRGGRILAVGVDDYKGNLTTLNYAVSDANAIFSTFDRLGFTGDLFLGPEAGREAILTGLAIMVRDAPPDQPLLFYFAGHGFTDPNGRAALVTAGTTPTEVEVVYLEEIVTLLSSHGADTAVVVDACLNKRGVTNPAKGLSAPPNPSNVTLVLAARPGEVTLEISEMGGGVFTQKLIQEIEAAGVTFMTGAEEDQCSLLSAFDPIFQSAIEESRGITKLHFPKRLLNPEVTDTSGPVFVAGEDRTYYSIGGWK